MFIDFPCPHCWLFRPWPIHGPWLDEWLDVENGFSQHDPPELGPKTCFSGPMQSDAAEHLQKSYNFDGKNLGFL